VSLSLVAPLIPIVLAAAALGRTVTGSVGEEGRRRDTHVSASIVALTSIALFLLGLGDVSVKERVLVAACAGTLWLLTRAQRDVRLSFASICAVALLAGGAPQLGIGLVPALALVIAGQRTKPPRLLRQGSLLFVIGVGVGYAVVGRTSTLITPSWTMAQHWLDGGVHAIGPIALVLAAAGLLLAVTGDASRRVTSLSLACVLVSLSANGHFDAASMWLIALALGLGLLECAAHLAASPVPGARFVLAPVIALALSEPLCVRTAALELSWPSLGPVPPHAMLWIGSCANTFS
jgi:hypothetical protein